MDPIARESLLLSTFGWWQFAVCLFAFTALMAIWWHLGRKKNDNGQVWLAISVLCWSLSGLIEVLYAHRFDESELLSTYKSDMGSLKSILSLANSFFILMALPYFRYLPGRLTSIIESDSWKYIVGIPFVLAIIPILAKYLLDREYNFVNDLDVLYSILTLIFLAAVLWESFARRKLKLLSILSSVCIIITLIAQLYKPLDNTLNQLLFSAIFKTCLIMIFFALALSWVKEVLETAQLVKQWTFDPQKIKIHQKGKNVNINGLGDGKTHQIKMTRMTGLLLQKFILRRHESKLDRQWLTITPIKNPDIKQENEIVRMLKRILDEILGKGEWDDKLFQKMRDSFRERGINKVRLLLDKENISTDPDPF